MIMERQLSLPSNNFQVFADYREQEIIEHLKKLGLRVNIVNLDVCDFVCNDIGIERKSFQDFISSILDGRIFEQAKRMIENYKKRVIIVEGMGDVERINENYYFSVLSYLAVNNVSLIFSRNRVETAKIIYWIVRKDSEKKELINSSFVVRKKEKELDKIQERILCAFPGISKVLSKRILKKFKSIKNFVLASENELMKIEGIGEKISKRIKDILEAEYEGD